MVERPSLAVTKRVSRRTGKSRIGICASSCGNITRGSVTGSKRETEAGELVTGFLLRRTKLGDSLFGLGDQRLERRRALAAC